MDLADQIRADQARFATERKARLERAGAFARDEFMKALSVQGSSQDHAAKGEPPRKQTGKLLMSTKVRMEGDAVVIYWDCPYAKFLLRDHDWIQIVAARIEPQVRSIIFGGT